MKHNIQADSQFVVIDSDILISPENQIDFASLNMILEGLCHMVCNRILHSPKTTFSIVIRNGTLYQLLNQVNPAQEILSPLDVLFKSKVVSASFLKDLKYVYLYFDCCNEVLKKGETDWVFEKNAYVEQLFKPIEFNRNACVNTLNKSLSEKAALSLNSNISGAFVIRRCPENHEQLLQENAKCVAFHSLHFECGAFARLCV